MAPRGLCALNEGCIKGRDARRAGPSPGQGTALLRGILAGNPFSVNDTVVMIASMAAPSLGGDYLAAVIALRPSYR